MVFRYTAKFFETLSQHCYKLLFTDIRACFVSENDTALKCFQHTEIQIRGSIGVNRKISA